MSAFRRTTPRNPVADGKCLMSDPCLDCSSGMGHPPMVSVYNAADGVYYLEQGLETCIARNAATGRGYKSDDICGEPAAKWAADVPLCGFHFRRLMRWISEDDEEETLAAVLKRRRRQHRLELQYEEELNQKRIQQQAERIAAAAVAKSPYSVIYYVRRASDGAVKIGFSASLKKRMMALRTEHGPLQALLTLGGDRDEEAEAHNKFRDYRIGRTEWFYPVRPLLEWIYQAREHHTHPDVQPDDILPMGELAELVLAAVPLEHLRFDDETGRVLWPPDEAAAA